MKDLTPFSSAGLYAVCKASFSVSPSVVCVVAILYSVLIFACNVVQNCLLAILTASSGMSSSNYVLSRRYRLTVLKVNEASCQSCVT